MEFLKKHIGAVVFGIGITVFVYHAYVVYKIRDSIIQTNNFVIQHEQFLRPIINAQTK